MITFSKEMQSANAPSPTKETFEDIVIFLSNLHPIKARQPILFNC
jgi:hypothetical protein